MRPFGKTLAIAQVIAGLLLMAGVSAGPAAARDAVKLGLRTQTAMPPGAPRTCRSGDVAVGLYVTFDRDGLSTVQTMCAQLDRTLANRTREIYYEPTGSISSTGVGAGAQRSTCPSQSVVVGMGYTVASTGAVVANLQPVCRNLITGTLVQLDGNRSVALRWSGMGRPDSCNEGEVVNGYKAKYSSSGLWVDVAVSCTVFELNRPNILAVYDPPATAPKNAILAKYGPDQTDGVYVDPADASGVRYARCLVFGNLATCDRSVASLICTRNGFNGLSALGKPVNVDHTRSYQTGEDCYGQYCRAVGTIICKPK